MIKVEALTRTYGDLKAVDQVSFEIGQGEIVWLLGHNGAGKTTFMKMLTGYLEPTGGFIEVDGLNIVTQREAVQSRIGYLPEKDPLYPEMTVIDYLDYGASLQAVPEHQRAQRIREAIDKTALTTKAVDPYSTHQPLRSGTLAMCSSPTPGLRFVFEADRHRRDAVAFPQGRSRSISRGLRPSHRRRMPPCRCGLVRRHSQVRQSTLCPGAHLNTDPKAWPKADHLHAVRADSPQGGTPGQCAA